MHIRADHSPAKIMNLFKWLIGKRKDRENKQRLSYKEKTVKILCMGKERVGKTAVIHKLCNREDFTEQHHPTLYDDHLKEIVVDEYKVSLQFMDMGGSQNFPSMQRVFIQQADIYILFYAVDDADSYTRMLEYRDKIAAVKDTHSTDLPLMVVRNKVDLKQRRLRKEVERRKALNKWCGKIYDVSAKTGLKINAIMDSLIEESKFIGNELLGSSKISGRYIFEETGRGKKGGISASEVYHKAPTLFGEKDNSDEKMEKRRRRSLYQPSRKMSRRSLLGRSSSFNGLKRRAAAENANSASVSMATTPSSSATHLNKDVVVAKQPWMRELERKNNEEKTASLRSNKSLSVASSSVLDQVRASSSFEKTESKESVVSQKSESNTPSNSNSNANNKNSTESLNSHVSEASTVNSGNSKSTPSSESKTERKRSAFKWSGKKASFDELSVPKNDIISNSSSLGLSAPKALTPRARKKSLSHTGINLLVPESRERSVSMHSPLPRIRKISAFRSDKKPKLEIVHTTLKARDDELDECNVEILPSQRGGGGGGVSTYGRSASVASRASKDSRDSFSSNLSNTTGFSSLSGSVVNSKIHKASIASNGTGVSVGGANNSRIHHKNSSASSGRRLSTSIDAVSDAEFDNEDDFDMRRGSGGDVLDLLAAPSPVAGKLTHSTRRRSLSQNDLSLGVSSFFNQQKNNQNKTNKFHRAGGIITFDERTSSSIVTTKKKLNSLMSFGSGSSKNKGNSLPLKLTETYAQQISKQPGVTSRRQRSHSLRRNRLSAQQAFADEKIEEVEEVTPVPQRKSLIHRKISNSADDVRRGIEQDSTDNTKGGTSNNSTPSGGRKSNDNNHPQLERPKSCDENRNFLVSFSSLRSVVKSRPTLKKDTFDGTPVLVAPSFAKM